MQQVDVLYLLSAKVDEKSRHDVLEAQGNKSKAHSQLKVKASLELVDVRFEVEALIVLEIKCKHSRH